VTDRIDYLPPEEIEETEVAAYDILRDAKYLSCAPREAIRNSQEWIEEARELLNDALAKAGC
jgi:hypothetical protein